MEHKGLLQAYYRITPINQTEDNLNKFTPVMLAGVLNKIAQARQANQDGNQRAVGFFIGRATAIVDALRDDLDLLHGGTVAIQYDSFYDQLCQYLEQAIAENNDQYLDKAEKIISRLADWWHSTDLENMPVQGNA